jgi:hypothetical protein
MTWMKIWVIFFVHSSLSLFNLVSALSVASRLDEVGLPALFYLR